MSVEPGVARAAAVIEELVSRLDEKARHADDPDGVFPGWLRAEVALTREEIAHGKQEGDGPTLEQTEARFWREFHEAVESAESDEPRNPTALVGWMRALVLGMRATAPRCKCSPGRMFHALNCPLRPGEERSRG